MEWRVVKSGTEKTEALAGREWWDSAPGAERIEVPDVLERLEELASGAERI